MRDTALTEQTNLTIALGATLTNTVGGTTGISQGVNSKASPDAESEVASVKTTANGNTSLTLPTPTSGASATNPESPNFSETSPATASGATSVKITNTVGGTIGNSQGVNSKTSSDAVSEVISVKTTEHENTGTSSLPMPTPMSEASGASPDSQISLIWRRAQPLHRGNLS